MKIKESKNKKAAIVTPAGGSDDLFNLKERLLPFGYDAVFYPQNPLNYLADNDQNRAKQIMDTFLDDKISLILALRGGYGCLRILDMLDYDIIKNHPKPLVGLSDITALLLNIYKKCGFITYHGPMGGFEISENLFETINKKITSISPLKNAKIINKGKTKGILWGGNLSTIVSMIGSDFIPEEDLILFLEDVNEPAYKIDRMLTQIFRTPELKKRVKALVLGDFSGVDNKTYLESLFSSIKHIPAVYGYNFGHIQNTLTLPVGQNVTFDDGHIQFML